MNKLEAATAVANTAEADVDECKLRELVRFTRVFHGIDSEMDTGQDSHGDARARSWSPYAV